MFELEQGDPIQLEQNDRTERFVQGRTGCSRSDHRLFISVFCRRFGDLTEN
jgi:hypothetical protein